MLYISKGRGGAGSGFIPRGALELLLLVLKSPSLRFFTQKSYRHFKISKIFEKMVKKQKPQGRIEPALIWVEGK